MNYSQFNIVMFRVECPVCLKRRPLREIEISDYHNVNAYWCYQFCSDRCRFRATEAQNLKVNNSKFTLEHKVLNKQLQS